MGHVLSILITVFLIFGQLSAADEPPTLARPHTAQEAWVEAWLDANERWPRDAIAIEAWLLAAVAPSGVTGVLDLIQSRLSDEQAARALARVTNAHAKYGIDCPMLSRLPREKAIQKMHAMWESLTLICATALRNIRILIPHGAQARPEDLPRRKEAYADLFYLARFIKGHLQSELGTDLSEKYLDELSFPAKDQCAKEIARQYFRTLENRLKRSLREIHSAPRAPWLIRLLDLTFVGAARG